MIPKGMFLFPAHERSPSAAVVDIKLTTLRGREPELRRKIPLFWSGMTAFPYPHLRPSHSHITRLCCSFYFCRRSNIQLLNYSPTLMAKIFGLRATCFSVLIHTLCLSTRCDLGTDGWFGSATDRGMDTIATRKA